MSHEYTYIFDDALTGVKRGVLPLYGVNFSDFLQIKQVRHGSFTGTIRMDNPLFTPEKILAIAKPGTTRIWVERDGVLIWGGLLWTHTYQSDGRSLQLSGQTFSSYLAATLYVVVSPPDGVGGAIGWPHNIMRLPWLDLMDQPTHPARYNIGVTVEPFHSDGGGTYNYNTGPNYQHYWQKYIDDMIKLDAECRIKIFYNTSGVRTALFESHFRGRLGIPITAATQYPILRYPGVISKYWMTENMSTAASKIVGFGQANGDSTIFYQGVSLPTGYFGVDFNKTYDTDNLTELIDFVETDLLDTRPPVINPVYELAGDDLPFDFKVGDRRRIVIDDPYRYPDGPMGGTIRIVGWQLTPESSESVEQLSLTIDDESTLTPIPTTTV